MEISSPVPSHRAQLLKDDGTLRRRDDNSRTKVQNVRKDSSGWLLAELERRFGYGLEELARRFDRSVSWVSQRLALVELLPATVQQQVRCGEIAPQVAMKYLVPVARSSIEQCQQMASVFASVRKPDLIETSGLTAGA